MHFFSLPPHAVGHWPVRRDISTTTNKPLFVTLCFWLCFWPAAPERQSRLVQPVGPAADPQCSIAQRTFSSSASSLQLHVDGSGTSGGTAHTTWLVGILNKAPGKNHAGNIGVILGPYWGSIGVMEKKMETTIVYGGNKTPYNPFSFHLLFHYPYITPRLPYIIPILSQYNPYINPKP